MRRIAAVALALAGCRAPVEKRQVATSEPAPLIAEVEADERPSLLLHKDELVEVVRAMPPVKWKASLDGAALAREGPMLEVRRASGDSPLYGFASDFGVETEVPTAAWLCDKMRSPPECARRLRRFLVEGGVFAYDPCMIGTCAVAVARGRQVQSLAIDGLADVAPALVEGRPVALASARWMKGPGWTGARVHVLRLDHLERALMIETEEIDSRIAPVTQKMGKLSVEEGVLVYRGTRKAQLPSGEVIRVEPLVEKYHLTK